MRSVSLRACTGAFLLMLAVGVASAQMSSQSMGADNEQQVKSAQDRLLQAVKSDNKEAAGRLMTEDLTWVAADGRIMRKPDLLANIPHPPNETTIDKVRSFGNVAVVTGIARFDDGHQTRFLQEWANRDGEWKLAAHQGTAVNPSSSSGMVGTTGGRSVAEATTGRSKAVGVEPTLVSAQERAVWKTQRDLQRAFLRGEVEAYSRLTSDDFVRVSGDGMLQTKADFAQTVRENANKKGGDIETSDVQIKVDGDTARLVLTSWGTYPGGKEITRSRVTRIFRRNNGQWQQVAAIFTPLNEQ